MYVPSTRIWTGKLNEIEYTNEYEIIRVRSCGKASRKGGEIYVSRALEGENVGIKEGENGLEIYFANVFLGIVNSDNTLKVKRRPGRRKIEKEGLKK